MFLSLSQAFCYLETYNDKCQLLSIIYQVAFLWIIVIAEIMYKRKKCFAPQ